jgi:uncharacterized protein (DUF1499 family)
MKKTMALCTIAGLSMASEFDGVADNDLHLYKLQNGITALVHTVDDELRVLPIDYHPSGPNRPHVIYTDDADDELRVLPIDYHPPRSRPSGPIRVDDADDELRVLPIDYHPSGPNRPHVIRTDDADDELRSLPFDYIPSTKYGGPRTVFADDDELRVFPIGYHPSGPSRPHVIYTDDVDDELRVLPIDYHPSGPNRPHVIYTDDADDELRVLPIDYHPSGPNRPHVIYTDDADDELRVLPIDYHPPRQTRPNRPIQADDDEFRVLPIDYHPSGPNRPHVIYTDDADDELRVFHIDSNLPRQIRPNRPIQADDDELRLIGVGPGSLTHKKNVTETVKPVEVMPKRFTTGAMKLETNISTNAADDEMRFAHFIPQYRPKKEDVEAKAADNTLVELSDLLKERHGGARNSGFLRKGK